MTAQVSRDSAGKFKPRPRYCFKCGATLKIVPAEGFDECTGRPRTQIVCPTGKCGHTNCGYHDPVAVPGFLSLFFKPRIVCSRCGEEF